MSNLTLRGLDEETSARLKQAAQSRGVSVNRHALELLRRGLGLVPRSRGERYHDLDHLAGTWSETDAREFADALAAFEQIDEALWR
jgi:plasmid stability protein